MNVGDVCTTLFRHGRKVDRGNRRHFLLLLTFKDKTGARKDTLWDPCDKGFVVMFST